MIVSAGAWDAHVHIFEAVSGASVDKGPEHASLADYRRVQQELGIDRTVLVQPSLFRFDNTGVLAALAAMGASARAVVTVQRDVSDAELHRLTELGVRGARFHLLKSTLQSWADLRPIAERVTPFGWHTQVQFDGRELPERVALLADVPGTLVIDQTGKFLEPVRPDDPAFMALLRLVDQGRTYVKISAPYEVSRAGPPDYADVAILARSLIRHAPDRVIWGSNWPHHAQPPDSRTTNGAMLDWVASLAPDAATLNRVLIANPAGLYD